MIPHATLRIGLLAPPPNVVMEVEMPRHLPDHASLHTMRVPRSSSEVTPESLREMTGNVESATRTLAMTRPALVVFGCTSASFINGLGWDRELAARIEAVAGVPAITTTTAIVEALGAVDARRVLLVTPYVDAVNRTEIAFLEDSGFEVTGLVSFNILESAEIAAVPSADVESAVLGASKAACAADAVFISCTNLRTMDRIAAVERALDRPVVTSNQATVWLAARTAGFIPVAHAAGRLLEGAATTPAAPRGEPAGEFPGMMGEGAK